MTALKKTRGSKFVKTSSSTAKDVAKASSSPDWLELLYTTLSEPAQLANAYKVFHQYSLSNRWMAASQLISRGLPLEPINTFKGWMALDRVVKKGEKALALIMPVPIKKAANEDEDESSGKAPAQFTRFMLRNFWFSLSQTSGEDYVPAPLEDEKAWDISAAFDVLDIKETNFVFKSINDTERMAFTQGREISVSPLAPAQTLARIREMGRIVLGHTDTSASSRATTEPGLQLIEAEAVAYLVGATLGIEGTEDSQARLQGYLADDYRSRVPERCASRAFSAADKLINAGYC